MADFDDLKRELDNINREISKLSQNLNGIQAELGDLKRELGVQKGKMIYDQVDSLYNQGQRDTDTLSHVQRDLTSVRRLLEYNEINVKEIMKALALIYRNVDDLEGGLLPEEEIKT